MNGPLRLWPAVFGVLILTGAEPPAPVPSAVAEGQAIAAELRAARPVENLQIQGVLRKRDAEGRRARVPFRYQVVVGSGGWRSIYEVGGADAAAGERLEVVYAEGRPTQYRLRRTPPPPAAASEPAVLTGDQAMVPFAGSDFWLADLGLEFVHWPEQRLVENPKVIRRKGRVCRVLESLNPARGARGYTRVRSWIDRETGKPILAEAYDADGRLLKEFEIGGLTRVNGRWELRDMEMRDSLTDSQTVLEFRYETPD